MANGSAEFSDRFLNLVGIIISFGVINFGNPA